MIRSDRARVRGLALLAGLSLIATAACGSTVQGSGSAVLGGAQGPGQSTDSLVTDGLGGDGLTAEGGGSGAVGAGTGSGGPAGSGSKDDAARGGAGASSGGSAGGPAQGPASGSGTGPAGGASGAFTPGPGVTDTSIFVGLPYCPDCAAANSAIGAGGEDPGDTRRYYQAALDEVNGRGGVLGRKLVPVWHEISASQGIDVSAQEMCETFTKDNKVAAIQFRGEIIYECAKKAGIIALGSGGSGPTFARYPNLFAHNTIRLERQGAATVKGMVAAGWHKPDSTWPTGRIGLVTWQDNEYEFAMKNGWLPALRDSGLKETEVRYIAVPQSDKSLADSSSAISAAVLGFRDKGIDHVFLADGPAGIFRGGGLTLQFLNAAKAQRYYPRYGFNSANAPGDPALPADQQVGMIAVDSNDFEASNDEGIALNPQRQRCYALMKKNDLKATDGGATGLVAVQACDLAWFMEAVFTKATRGTTLQAVIAAAESLGTSYRSPFTYGTRIGPGRHDGVSVFRNARFDEACSCMKYTSKPYEP